MKAIKGKLRASRQGDHRHCTTESHRTLTTQLNTMQQASKTEHPETQTNKKSHLKYGDKEQTANLK